MRDVPSKLVQESQYENWAARLCAWRTGRRGVLLFAEQSNLVYCDGPISRVSLEARTEDCSLGPSVPGGSGFEAARVGREAAFHTADRNCPTEGFLPRKQDNSAPLQTEEPKAALASS